MEKLFYAVEEASKILGRSRDRIYEALRSGLIKGTRLKKGYKWLIPKSELEKLGAQIEETIHEQLTAGAILNLDGEIESCPAGPKALVISYGPRTWPWSGHAYVVENGIEKKVPVAFDPHRFLWRRLQESSDNILVKERG